MKIIADLHIHSKFARAVSPQMTIPNIAAWAKRKGIDLIATGDFTHPLWFKEIERDLEEVGNGFLKLKKNSKTFAEVANENLDPSSVGKANLSIQHDTKEPSEAGQNLPAGKAGFIGSPQTRPNFLLSTEISCIYSQNGKGRRVHTLVFVPTLESVRKINQEMTKRGCNLMSDGRPIIGLSSIDLADLVLSIEPKALIIPAHIWTPWFSVFGAMSGYKTLAEAFGDYAKNIYAIETGLSSNPSMNWQIKELDNRAIVSFSDAHSGPKIGREATVFEIPDGKLSYEAIYTAIKNNSNTGSKHAEVANENLYPSSIAGANNKISRTIKASEAGQNLPAGKAGFIGSPHAQVPYISYTIEFYPEEGKYHYTGHRACNIRWGPEETRAKGTVCPVCGKPLTQGVMQRVEELAARTEAELKIENVKFKITDNVEIQMIKSKVFPNRPPFVMLVPLQEIIAEAIGSPVASNKTQIIYTKLTDELGGEFNVLLHSSKADIIKHASEKIAEGIEKARTGNIVIDPGYDGVFGVVKIWKEGETSLVDKSKEQLGLF